MRPRSAGPPPPAVPGRILPGMSKTTEPEAPPARTPPAVTDLNRAFWTGGAEGQLMIQRCRQCDHWVHPPVASCPGCGGIPVPEPVSGRGTVFTYTVNHHPFNPAVPVPYVIALVELVEQTGLRFTTNVVNCAPEEVRVGLPVRVLFEHHGDVYVPVFEPAPDDPA